jgi:hypothetical protein
MGLFNRSRENTPVRRALRRFSERFAGYSPGEQTRALSTLAAIREVTGRGDMSKLSEDLMTFVKTILPSLLGGNVGPELVVAIEEGDPLFRRGVVSTVGEQQWQNEVARARSALS